jgi:AcrR family transcriptional regulator
MATSSRRRTRETDLVKATRALFDERGMQDAPVEEIARAVGIARGLIYRQFSSKEELYVLTVTDYLGELAGVLDAAIDRDADPETQLEHCLEAYAGFCRAYPAFLDCSMSLMRRPARDLREMVSESVWIRLGQGMARCLEQVAEVLRAFGVTEPEYVANLLWTQTLGAMHLARIGVGVSEPAPGLPALFRVTPEQIVASCVQSAMATVRAHGG